MSQVWVQNPQIQRDGSGESASSVVSQRKRRAIPLWVRNLVLGALALLLGHATIAHVVSPFALAYYVILYEILGRRKSLLALAAVGGPFVGVSNWHSAVPTAAILLASMGLYGILRGLLFRKKTPDIHLVPFLAALVDIGIRLAASGTVWTRYDILTALADGALVVVLALIFVQCMPFLVGRNVEKQMRSEQLISLAIFAGSVISGLSGLSVYHVLPLTIAVDAAVLTMAAVGGVGVGTTIAIVIGLLSILNHDSTFTDVAMLAFAALLAGIVKETGRFWTALAFVTTLTLLSAGVQTAWPNVEQVLIASGAAGIIFLCIPKAVRDSLASYVPGTPEYHLSEQQRVRRVRALLSEKIDEIGQVFDELSAAFSDVTENQMTSAQQLMTHVVGTTAKEVCGGCPRRSKCWDKEGYATYQAMVHTITRIEERKGGVAAPTQDLKDRCIRLDSMMGVLRNNLELTERDAKWIEKLREQKGLVAAQLAGVANVIRTFAAEIHKSTESSVSGEEQIISSLEQLGLYVDHVHIVNLDPGKVEVEITQPSRGAYENSVRVIAPLLSGIVGENITVRNVSPDGEGPCTSVFSSARLFDVTTAVATAAKEGRLVSGDTHTAADLGNGRYAVALSDGMGNGERASKESKAAIELLKKLLKAGFDEQLAIKTVNSTLLLRSRDEMFTTLDMVLVDLFSARAEFLKIGSAPSFIRRGKSVRAICGANVPIGILQDIEVQAIEEQLCDGDILIMMSDGVYDAPQQLYDKDDWLMRHIERLEVEDPQAMADTLLETVIRMTNGQVGDDMTVMVAIVSRHQPEWAAIKLPGVVGLRQNRDGARRGA